jgi:hypothetical protein
MADQSETGIDANRSPPTARQVSSTRQLPRAATQPSRLRSLYPDSYVPDYERRKYPDCYSPNKHVTYPDTYAPRYPRVSVATVSRSTANDAVSSVHSQQSTQQRSPVAPIGAPHRSPGVHPDRVEALLVGDQGADNEAPLREEQNSDTHQVSTNPRSSSMASDLT